MQQLQRRLTSTTTAAVVLRLRPDLNLHALRMRAGIRACASNRQRLIAIDRHIESSIVELAEQRSALEDPEGRVQLGGHLDRDDEVGRHASGREGAGTD